MKNLIILFGLLLTSASHAQSINDLVKTYLEMNGIAWSPGDWSTAQVDGQSDRILTWSAAKLGLQPTAQQYAAAQTYWTNQQQAAQFSSVLASGIQISCAAGATICTSAIVGTYAVDENAQLKIASAYASIKGGDGLPGGGSQFLFKDIAGTGHMFTAAQFSAFAVKARDFYYGASVAVAEMHAGQAVAWPSAAVQLP